MTLSFIKLDLVSSVKYVFQSMFLDILVKYKHVGVSEEVSQLFSENPIADTELHSSQGENIGTKDLQHFRAIFG